MATEAQENSSPGETQDQESQDTQGQQQNPTSETEGNGEQQQTSAPKEPVRLPDDHPLVKKLSIQKAEIASHKTELAEARAQSAKATKLQEELDARPTQESLDTLQTRYDRLEAFAQAVGLGRALDSRSFTRDLFESDKDVAALVKEWNSANPTATRSALSSSSAEPSGGKIDPNQLIRAAHNSGK